MRALWRRFKNGYLNLNLQTKFTIALISIVVIPACLTAFLFYGRLYSMVVSNTIRQEQDASAKTAPLIERTMDTILATTRNITGQNFFQELFYMPVSDSAEQLATSNHATDFKNAVQRLTTDSIVTDVQIYVDFPDDLKTLDTYPNTKNILAPLSQAKGTYWYGIFQGNRNTQEMFCPSFYLGPREKKNYGDMAYICPLSLYYHSTAYKAYLAVYYSDDKLTSILSDNLSLEGSVSYIVNERDAIVATSDLSLSGIYQLDYDTIKASFMSSNNFIERNILDTKVYAGFYSISNTDWFMVTVLPSPPLIHASNRLMVQIVLIYAVFLVLALIFANVLAHSITGRLSSVIRQMQTVRHGPPTPMESPQAHDEIGNLIDTYNYMTRKMEELMEKQAKAAEDLRIAEFNSLQAQINPHFLYNVLDTINWMARKKGEDNICHMVTSISSLMRASISNKRSMVYIREEIKYVQDYLYIQETRYGDKFTSYIEVDERLNELEIPKMTIQTLVENAVVHGVENATWDCFLYVSGEITDGMAVFTVKDDGVGMSQEQLEKLMGTEEEPDHEAERTHTHLGVYAVRKRLDYVYQNKARMSITSEPGKETQVILEIPMNGNVGVTYRKYDETVNENNKKGETRDNGIAGNDIR